MTVVASGLDGKLFDNAVPRFLYAGAGLDYDRVMGRYLWHSQLVSLGLTGEIGAEPAGLVDCFDFAGEGSNAPIRVTVGGTPTTTITLALSGGPVNGDMVVHALFMLNGTGAHKTAPVIWQKGWTAAQCAAALGPAIDALPDITDAVAGANITVTCATFCTYASVFSIGEAPPLSGSSTPAMAPEPEADAKPAPKPKKRRD